MTNNDGGSCEHPGLRRGGRNLRFSRHGAHNGAKSLSGSVKRLEARMGMRLFNRTTRSVAVSEAGDRVLDRLAGAMTKFEAALDPAHDYRATPGGTLKLRCRRGYGGNRLVA